MDNSVNTIVRCTFCNYEFTEEEARADCGKCALFGGCRFLRCPRCGFEMPQTPGMIKAIKGWLAKRRRRAEVQPASEFPLAQLGTGGRALVISVGSPSDHDRSKLAALGLMPGANLRLIQKFPSYVVSIGHTQIAFDKQTAADIRVQPHANPN